jgi:hypothetical protein
MSNLKDIMYKRILMIPRPSGRGGWPGDKLKSRKFPLKEVELHEKRTDNYDGITLYPPKIGQTVLNNNAHMVVMSNRGKEFDSVWKNLVATVQCMSYAVTTFVGGLIVLAFGLGLWPITMLIWMYSSYNVGMYYVNRSRYYSSRSRQTLNQQFLPSEGWSDPAVPYGGESTC